MSEAARCGRRGATRRVQPNHVLSPGELLVSAHFGVLVRFFLTGDTIYALNERRMMVPASNQKLLTVAAAARRLGWDFRYTTRVLATGAVRVTNSSFYVVTLKGSERR